MAVGGGGGGVGSQSLVNPGADPEDSERGGRVPHPLPPPPEWKLYFPGHAAIK